MKTPEQWAQEIELRCVADNRRPRMSVEADVIREAVNERVEAAISVAREWHNKIGPCAPPGSYRDGIKDSAAVIWAQVDCLKAPVPQ